MALGTIQPAEYYDQEHGGKIPVFRPTMKEFKDFKAFMEAIDDFGKRSGIVKVIPPKEWKDRLPDIAGALAHVRVRNPIVQHIMGSQGMYTQTNVERHRPYTLEQWHSLCEQPEHRPPVVGADRTARPAVTRTRKRQKTSEVLPPYLDTRPKSPSTRSSGSQPSKEKTKREIASAEIALASSDKPVPLTFDTRCPDPQKYSVEYCKELERVYWRNLTFTQPMYGADMLGTLFDKSVSAWNVSSLDNMLNRLGVSVPGVNEPYLYFGMWKATFAWHVEDMDLYSINYLHFGAPKQWYSIPTSHSKRFESVMQNLFYEHYKACPEFLRHKTFIVSPKVLAHHGVPVQRCVQHEGEFIITFPFGYHAGYNLGFNCAESVNFALDSWIEIGKRAKACNCISDSVTIDMSIFENEKSNLGDDEISGKEAAKASPQTRRRKRTDHDLESNVDTKCILCPDSREPDLQSVQGQSLHRICAQVIPEVHIEKKIDAGEIVQGVQDIPKARWKLVCQICKDPVGACAQCCKGKCCRAFHGTCAEKASLVVVESNEHGGKTYRIYCFQHHPSVAIERRRLKERQKQEKMEYLTPGRHVIVRFRAGSEYPGMVESCEPEKESARILFQDGYSRKIPWRDISILDT